MSTSRIEALNTGLRDKVPAAILGLFPLKTEDGKVEVRANRVYSDGAFDPSKLNDQQHAREHGGDLGDTLFADLELWRDGKKVQTRQKLKIGKLPLVTNLGTVLAGGNDWFFPLAQTRLKPGVYTREMSNGEFESFIPMKGATMTVWMDPARGKLKLSHGTTNVDLYPILRTLGTSDDQIVQMLGGDRRARELLEANKSTSADKDVDKLFQSVFHLKQNRDLLKGGIIKPDAKLEGVDTTTKIAAIKQWMATKTVDPYVTRKTLGQPIDVMGPDLLLHASRRILEVQRGDADPDDRDAPEFKTAHGLEDLMSERVVKVGRLLKRKALKKLTRPDATLGDAFGAGWVSPATSGFFGGSLGIPGGLAHTAEAANPLAILSERSKMTILGDGGIQSDHAVQVTSRLFRPGATNFVDSVHTAEGANIGIAVHAASNVIKEGNTIKAPFYVVTGGQVDFNRRVMLSIEDANDTVVSYPEYWDRKTGKPIDPYEGGPATLVRANVNGSIAEVLPSRVKYVIPSGTSTFDHTSNAALLFSNTHANRGMMAGKHLTQALPLLEREKPLFHLTTSEGKDVLSELARPFVVRARVAGKVTKVTDDAIWIGDEKHEIFNRYPMQAKVALHHTAVVKVGDTVAKGDLLADSNYTRDGSLALGVNLRSAYTPWKNATNFEDAIVISESAAHKLASDHTHRLELDPDDLTQVDAKLFMAQFPTQITGANLAKLKDGVIAIGSKIHPGDVLIAAVRKREFNELDRSAKNLGAIHKMLMRPYVDASVKWDEDFEGEVYRVVRSGKKIEVHVKTAEPIRVGDKLSMSSAAKGTISAVVADDKMPRDAKDRHIEVIFNPHGVAGRINPSQTIEQAIGKLARDAGVKYEVANFDGVDHASKVNELLKKHGMPHEEILFDPETGRKTENPVATGYNYVLKLDHLVRKKFSARTRDGYTLDETPTSGKGKGGQSFDQLTTYALLGHNAHAILGESFGIRGTKNDDYWQAYQAGETPPPPKVPFVFEKFRAFLHASGVDTAQRGNMLHYLPMTDASTLARSNGEITDATIVRGKDLAEEDDGIFDKKITGGVYGSSWSHIDIGRKIPHPLYEKVIRDVTGIKGADFLGLVGQTRHYEPKSGKFFDEPTANTVTGEDGFRHLLSFDVDKRLAEMKQKTKTAVGSDRNKFARATRYLRGVKETGIAPFDAYMTSKVPVLPPKYRPLLEMKQGGLRVADANLLYRDVILTKRTLESAEKHGDLPNNEMAKARIALYDAMAGLIGVGKPLTERRDNELQGFVDVIRGKSNKEGLFQRQLARRRNDYTGRSTIEPDANLGPDEIGIPEEMAWKIYQPAIVRRLAQLGMKPADAVKAVEGRLPMARAALHEELKTRPVLYNRAPSLHRYSVLAAMPFLTAGKEIKISPAVINPLGADFDGDTMSVMAPLTEDARRESFNLLPSKNLFYDKDRSVAFNLEKDVITGLFALTRRGSASGRTYPDRAAAMAAYQNNKDGLRMDSLVLVNDEKNQGQQAVGWLIFETVVPPRYLQGIAAPVDGKKLQLILERIAKQSPGDYNILVRRIQQAGFTFAAQAGGITSTVGELAIDRTKITQLLKQLQSAINKGSTDAEKREIALKVYKSDTQPGVDKEIENHLNQVDLGGAVFLAAKPSGKLGFDSYRQMLASPVLVKDVNDRIVPTVIRSSLGGGMTLSDYILTTPGARAGMVAKSLSTAQPGFLAKEVAGNMGPVRIAEKDCGTENGIDMELTAPAGVKNHDADLLDRHLLRDISGTQFRRNDVVTPELLARLRDRGDTMVWVRSAMTCQAAKSPCQMCAGRQPDGKLHAIGANIGIDYGQTVSERSTQLVLRSTAGLVAANGGVVPFSMYFKQLTKVVTKDAFDVQVGDCGVVRDVDGDVPVDAAERHAPMDTPLLLTTRSGSVLLVQADHPMWAVREQIRPGFSNRHVTLVGDETYSNTKTSPRVRENRALVPTVVEARDLTNEDAIWVDYQCTATPELANDPLLDGYYVGYYAGDGCVRRGNGRARYENIPVAVVLCLKGKAGAPSDVERAINTRILALTGATPVQSEKMAELYSPAMAQAIDALVPSAGLESANDRRPSTRKALHWDLTTLSDEWAGKFLAGMIDTDGSVTRRCNVVTATIVSTSFELASQLTFLAHRFDCRVSVQVVDACPSREEHWSTAFVVQIRFHSDRGVPSTKLAAAGPMGGGWPYRKPVRGYDPISKVVPLQRWDGWLYDVKTPTESYMAGTIQNHNSFHSGGTIGSSDGLFSGFARLRELLSAPDQVRNQGSLADVAGRVDAVRSAPQGGWYVHIKPDGFGAEATEHYVSSGRVLKVKVGDKVAIGDQLSDGSFRPQEIAAKKGSLAAQQYVVNEARKAYQDAGAVVRKPVLEVLAASTLRYVEITDDGGEKDLAPGDVMHENEYNVRRAKNPRVRATPTVPGLSRLPIVRSTDLMERLNFQRLEDSLREIPAIGGKSDLTGSSSPISGFAYGAKFRQRDDAITMGDSAFNRGAHR